MRTISFIFAVIFSFALWADNDKGNPANSAETKISGKVVDHFTGENLTGVKILVMNTDNVVYTDFDGNFTIYLPADKSAASIQISYISYETAVMNVEEIRIPGEIKILPVARH